MLDFTSALYLGFRHPSARSPPGTRSRSVARRHCRSLLMQKRSQARLPACKGAKRPHPCLRPCIFFAICFACWAGSRWSSFATLKPIRSRNGEPSTPQGWGLRFTPLPTTILRRSGASSGAWHAPTCGRSSSQTATARVAEGSPRSRRMPKSRGVPAAISSSTTPRRWVFSVKSPSRANPYGNGGGGSLRWHGTFGPHILVGSSLAKGFGVPLAVLSGSRDLIDLFRERSETRIHCSPPSAAVIHAAHRALHVNRRQGDTLRQRLLDLVARLRQRLMQAGLTPAGSLPFPVQSFHSQLARAVPILLKRLLRGESGWC